jgi:hypothetical protein
MSLTLRERLAHLIAAFESPEVRRRLEYLKFHPAAAQKYLRELQQNLELKPTATADECFDAILEKAKKFDRKLAKAECFPPSRAVKLESVNACESAMTYNHSTYVGGCSPAERTLLSTRRIDGLAPLLDVTSKARNLLAVGRYYAGDFLSTKDGAIGLVGKTIDLLINTLTDYWSDLLVVDRDYILDAVGVHGKTVYVFAKAEGWGTWVVARSSQIPDNAVSVVKVTPSKAELVRRAPQLPVAA